MTTNKQSPTEDTSTPSKLIKFEHTVGSHSDDRGGDSDRRCTCQDGAVGQDDKQLREAIMDIFMEASGMMITPKQYVDQILAIFQKEQLKLVTELEGELPEKAIPERGLQKEPCGRDKCGMCNRVIGYNDCLADVTARLEHKKQELEGRK